MMAAMGMAGLEQFRAVAEIQGRHDEMSGTKKLAVGIVGSDLLEYVLEVEKAKKNHTLSLTATVTWIEEVQAQLPDDMNQ